MADISKMVSFIKKVMRDKMLLYDLRNLNQIFFSLLHGILISRGGVPGGDRQTDGWTDRWTDRWTDGQAYTD